MPNSNITEVYSKIKFQSIDEKKVFATGLCSVAFSLSSVGQYLGFAGSNPSTRRKIENGSMEIRKKLGAKKAEKSLEISAFHAPWRDFLGRI